jgi:acyl-CoA synthetase (AMP-forming)/AMP-acid ligase II
MEDTRNVPSAPIARGFELHRKDPFIKKQYDEEEGLGKHDAGTVNSAIESSPLLVYEDSPEEGRGRSVPPYVSWIAAATFAGMAVIANLSKGNAFPVLSNFMTNTIENSAVIGAYICNAMTMKGVNNRSGKFDDRLKVVVVNQNTMKVTQDTIVANQNTMKATQDTMKAAQDTMKATQDTMKAAQDTMKATQDTMEGDIAKILVTQGTMEGSIANIMVTQGKILAMLGQQQQSDVRKNKSDKENHWRV